MHAIARVISSSIRSISSDADEFQIIAIFCAIGLTISIFAVAGGVDIVPLNF